MRLALDLDGVCFGFIPTAADLYMQHFGLPMQNTDRWDGIVSGTHFKSEAEFFNWFAEARGWWDMPTIPGAIGGIAALKAAGHSIVHVTARPIGSEPNTLASLRELHGNPRFNDVWFRPAAGKHTVPADLFVDDSPEVITSLAKHGRKVVRFEQPWNVDMKLPKGVETVDGWAALVEMLTGTSWKKVA